MVEAKQAMLLNVQLMSLCRHVTMVNPMKAVVEMGQDHSKAIAMASVVLLMLVELPAKLKA